MQLKASDITQHYTNREYSTYQLDEETTQAPSHGLMLYLHKRVKLHHISKYPGDKVEAINVIISKESVPFNIVGLYKSPKTLIAELANSVKLILKDHNELPLILIGDFNLDVANRANKVFCDMMKTKYDYNQYVTQPASHVTLQGKHN